MLNYDQLQVAIAAAKQQFDLLQKKHPNLKAYLVLSSPGGQIDLESPPKQILSEFPAMVVNDTAKTKALKLMAQVKAAQTDSEKERLEKQLDQLAVELKYDGNCQVEVRFKNLNYDQVGTLQVDDLVDRNLTRQSKSSIRIVLSTLSRFIIDPPPLKGKC